MDDTIIFRDNIYIYIMSLKKRRAN